MGGPSEHYLYAIEWSNGVVKVGRTYSPRNRMAQHLAQVKGAVQMVRYEVALVNGTHSHLHEADVLTRLSRIGGVPLPGTTESFVGVCYGQALTLIRQVVAREYVEASRWGVVNYKAPPRRVEGADPVSGDFSRGVSHGKEFCPREPLNTTQLIGETL
jgi:hypothetical protein